MALTTLILADPAIPSTPTTSAFQPSPSVDWARVRAAVAVSAARKSDAPNAAKFMSSGVMISPTIGLTAGHSLDQVTEAHIIEAVVAASSSAKIKIKNKLIHPAYRGNNFTGIDLAVFSLETPLKLPQYFVPTALSTQVLRNEILQRLGHGARQSTQAGASAKSAAASNENRRTWVLENYNRRLTGTSYLTSVDQYGFPGDSGGPVYRTQTRSSSDVILELVGIHVGRMMDSAGNLVNESNTLILTSDLLEWIKKTTRQWETSSKP